MFGVGILFVLFVLLIMLIPSLLSTGMVRSRVVSAVNQNLNGRLDIESWSIGWTGGIRADGIKVFDDANRQVVEIDHVSTQLSLLGAAFGHIHLGKTVVDGLDFNAEKYTDGTLNLSKLAKVQPGAANAPGGATSPAGPSGEVKPSEPAGARKAEPIKVPAIDGEFQLIHCRGTLTTDGIDRKTNKPTQSFVKFTVIDGDVNIPDINQPITDSLKIVANTGGALSRRHHR